MLNKRGMTAHNRLREEIEQAEKTESAEHREILAIKALGAADLAVEFGLITYKEWEEHIHNIFNLM